MNTDSKRCTTAMMKILVMLITAGDIREVWLKTVMAVIMMMLTMIYACSFMHTQRMYTATTPLLVINNDDEYRALMRRVTDEHSHATVQKNKKQNTDCRIFEFSFSCRVSFSELLIEQTLQNVRIY